MFQAIHNASFAITPLHEQAYQLDIAFLDKTGDKLSNNSTIFSQQKGIQSGEILDIYSQNGVSCNPTVNLFQNQANQLFSTQDERGIIKAAKKIKSSKLTGPVVLVLDLKDQEKKYANIEGITQSEKAVCEFYKQGSSNSDYLKRAKKVHSLLKQAPLDFVICEGSLKHDLLHNFSEAEAEWLLSKEGGLLFCQYAEYYMNGFKFGHESTQIHSKKYITPISSKYDSFQAHSKSKVWYPKIYKDVYASEGQFMSTLKPVFSIEGCYEESSGITSISVEVKQS